MPVSEMFHTIRAPYAVQIPQSQFDHTYTWEEDMEPWLLLSPDAWGRVGWDNITDSNGDNICTAFYFSDERTAFNFKLRFG